MATEDKAKDNVSIAVKSVATGSTTEASKVILRFLNNATVVVTLHHIYEHCRWCKFSSYYVSLESQQNSEVLILNARAAIP